MPTSETTAARRLLRRLADPKTFRDIDVLVVGDVVLDRCLYTDRIATPRFKQPLLNVLKYEGKYQEDDDRLSAGAAGMIARVARAYRANARLCGIAGRKDREKKELEALLAKDGIRCRLIDTGPNSTPIVARFYARIAMDRYVEHVRVDRESPNLVSAKIANKIVKATRQLIDEHRPDALILGDFARGVICGDVAKRLVSLAREKDVAVVTLDGKKCWEALEEPLDLVVLSVEEAWKAISGGDGYPVEWAGPGDYREFVVALMEKFPNVRRFLINDPYGCLLAIERDEYLHGEYRYACISPPPRYEVRSPVGSEVVTTVLATLCLAENTAAQRHPGDEFFEAAYGARYGSCVQMGTLAEVVADQKELAQQLKLEPAFEAVPKGPADFHGPSVWKAVSEDEVHLQKCIKKLGGTVSLKRARTAIPGFNTVHTRLRKDVNASIRELTKLLGKPLPKPARLWIHGEPGCGKDFIFEQIANEVLRCPLLESRPDQRSARGYSLKSLFEDAEEKAREKAKRACVAINEIDKEVPEKMQGELLTLLDNKGQPYGNLLVVGVASKTEEGINKTLLPDVRRRFDHDREDAVTIEIPSFRERVEDLPYLLVSCMLRHAGKRRLPREFSKPALEILARVPDLPCFEGRGVMTFATLNAAAKRLLYARARVVHASQMAEAFGLKPEEGRTIFFQNEKETVKIDTSSS